MMDVMWEKAVETALGGDTDYAATQTLTLDGAVKCVKGKLPPRSLLEKFQNLQHLSIANIGVSSLDQFPRLPKLRKLVLSDNRIAGGLQFLVDAGLHSLRDLDLSNNRIHFIEDLAPLAQLTFVSLDLYECPVTRLKDYRSRVFGLIKSLKYLDKMDAEENERPESDDDEEEEEEEDPGSCEIDAEDWTVNNGHSEAGEGIVDVDEDEDEESDADEEETECARFVNGPEQNGFRVAAVEGRDVAEENDEENEGREEIDEEGDDDDVVEVYEIEDSDDEEDGVEDDDSDSDGDGGGDDDDDDDDDSDSDDDDDDDEEEEVDNVEGGLTEPGSTGRLTSTEGEIDGHERGEDVGDEDDNGETGEDEQGIEDEEGFEDQDDGEEEDEESGAGYLVQPVGPAGVQDAGGSYMEEGHDEGEDDDGEGEEEVEDDDEVEVPSSSSHLKRKRDGDIEGDEDDGGEDDEEDDDVVENSKSSKKHH